MAKRESDFTQGHKEPLTDHADLCTLLFLNGSIYTQYNSSTYFYVIIC